MHALTTSPSERFQVT